MPLRRWFAAVAAWMSLYSGASAADWPMWRADATRSASNAQQLAATLHLAWSRKLPELEPAWPDQAMMQFDAAYEPVVAGKRVFVASSFHNTVTAYDTETGKELWCFTTDGPVRFAPVCWEGSVFAGSDDGYLYCLDQEKGSLTWKFRGGPSDRKVLGNQRLISMWPIRGAPVVADGTVYFAAGIWPFMGIFLHALDAKTGKVIWTNDGDSCNYIKQPHSADSFAGVAPQGPLVVAGDRLVVPGGRSVPACYDRKTGKLLYYHHGDNGKRGGGSEVYALGEHFVSGASAYSLETGKFVGAVPRRVAVSQKYLVAQENLSVKLFDPTTAMTKSVQMVDRKGKKTSVQTWKMEEVGRADTRLNAALIEAGDRVYVGGDGEIQAFDLPLETEKKSTPSWHATVKGTVVSLVAADDRLFAVTKDGMLHCFAAEKPETVAQHVAPTGALELTEDDARQARALLNLTGVRAGYALFWGLGAGRLPRAIVAHSELNAVVMEEDPVRAERERSQLRGAGMACERLTVFQADPDEALLPPYLANLLIAESPGDLNPTALKAMFQTLRPFGGTACFPVQPARQKEIATILTSLQLPGAKIRFNDQWLLLVRDGPLPGTANWTHEHCDAANTRVSRDQLVRAPLGLLWFGGTSHDGILPRHGHGPQPQVMDGRVFIEGVDMMRAMDVYTGRILWETKLPGVGTFFNNLAHQPGANASGTNFISTPDGLYIAYRNGCLRLDPATGKKMAEFPLPGLPNSQTAPRWGYINVVGDFLIGGADPLFDPTITPTKPVEKPDKDKDKDKKEEDNKDDKDPKDDKDKDKEKKDDPITKLLGKVSKFTNDNLSASRHLVVLDRHSGKMLWTVEAKAGFRHNAICVGGGRLYCIDRLSGPQINKMKRLGQNQPFESRLLAFDLKTGKELWRSEKEVFGTWLSYSAERDILVEAGRVARDTISDEPTGMRAYQAASGTVLWFQPKHLGPAMIHRDTILMGGNACSLLTGAIKTRPDPLTGEPVEWVWTRNYGCNTPAASEHLLTFRSGAAGFYDLCSDGGTGNLGGFRSSCTNNLIVANGVLSAPDYTRTCTCNYQNQCSLALVHMPEVEMWTFFGAKQGKGAVKRVGLNFGAPGDRRAENGTLWVEYPSVGGKSPTVPISTAPAKPEFVRRHSATIKGDGPAWVAASAVKGLHGLTVELVEKNQLATERHYTVRLHFAELEDVGPGERVFDVTLQGEKVLKELDPVKEAGGRLRSIVKEFKGVKVKRELVVTFQPSTTAKVGESLINGIEIVEEEAAP